MSLRRRCGLLAAALIGVAAPAHAIEVVPSACTRAIAAAEVRAGLPRGVLMAIGFGEAGRRIDGGSTVWPWTVNVGGTGHYFATKSEAIDFVREQQAAGRQSIDVGCLQVNLRWHPDAFSDLDAAFDPELNVAYAARFLGQLRAAVSEPGLAGWTEAVGSYHSALPERAEPYRAQVARYWQQLGDPGMLAMLAGGRDTPVPARRVNPNDPFGMELVAYWASPFGAGIGPKDEVRPVFDMAVRRPFAAAEAPAPVDTVPTPTRKMLPPAPIRRFSAAQPLDVPVGSVERRRGLMLEKSLR